ncbi:MAG: hypothetical protein H8F28_26980 [Fibrella sp.]|nr:hypothetical protein [Armatimonadota bacterium]
MSEYDRIAQGRRYEGYAFTFCKAAFLVLLFRQYSLLALSGLATLFYLLAASKGVKEWHCWAKPPYVTVFWFAVFCWEIWHLWGDSLRHLMGTVL